MFTLAVLKYIFRTKEKKVPEQFMKMVRIEFKSVSEDFVTHFYNTHKRLPSIQELYDAM